jgi:hypothetical protein
LTVGTTHLHHINQKVREVLRMRTRGSVQEQSPAVLNSLDVSNKIGAYLLYALRRHYYSIVRFSLLSIF